MTPQAPIAPVIQNIPEQPIVSKRTLTCLLKMNQVSTTTTVMPTDLTDGNNNDVQHCCRCKKQTKVWSKIVRTESSPYRGRNELREYGEFLSENYQTIMLTHSVDSWAHAVQDHHNYAPQDLHFCAINLQRKGSLDAAKKNTNHTALREDLKKDNTFSSPTLTDNLAN